MAPYVPPSAEDNFDSKHVNNNDWKDAEVVQENSLLLRRNSVQALFKGYMYDKASLVHRMTATTGKYTSIMETNVNNNEPHGEPRSRSQKRLKDHSQNPHHLDEDLGDENVIEEDDQ